MALLTDEFDSGLFAYLIPVFIAQAVMTLRSARLLLSAFRAYSTNTAKSIKGSKAAQDASPIYQHRAYAYAETIIEVRIMIMFALVGVLGVQWSLDVPSGRTVFVAELSIATTLHLFVHLLLSIFCVFSPEAVSSIFLESSSSPMTARSIVANSLFLLDVFANVGDMAFLATVVRHRMITVAVFLFSIMLYRVIDRGLQAAGRVLYTREAEEQASISVEPNPASTNGAKLGTLKVKPS